MGRSGSVGAAFQDIATVMLGAGITSFLTERSLYLWLVALVFAGVLATATMLFDRLASPVRGFDTAGWIRSALMAAVGAAVGAGQLWLAPVEGMRVIVLMLLAVLFAWILAAWRQRWGERRVYRAALRELGEDPQPLES